MICTFSPHDYLYETFKQPYALVPHLYPVATGSAFLVDPKGKPKDNISVSVIPLRFGWQRRPIFRELLRGAAVWHGKKAVCRPYDPNNPTLMDRSNPPLLDF